MWVMKCCIMLSLNYSFVWCTCLNYLNLNWDWIWFKFPRENKKQSISKLKKKQNSISAQPTQSDQARSNACSAWQAVPACQRKPALARSLSLSSSAQWGRPVGANFPRTRSTLSVPRAPARQRCEPFTCDLSLSLHRGPALSAPSSPQPLLTHVRMHAKEIAHVACLRTHLLFEPCPHLLSLPRLISPTLALSRALPPTPVLARDPHPPFRPSIPLEAAPSCPEHRPEVRNTFTCLVSLNSALP
jgi:hypothetical protein